MGHIILFDRHAEWTATFEMYERQKKILSGAAELGGSVFGMDISRDEMRMDTIKQKAETNREVERLAAREICGMAQGQSISLEYLPYARQIVEAEDVLEK